MGGFIKSVPIDHEKIIAALNKRNLSMKHASEEMGYNSYYIKSACDNGKISLTASKLLKKSL